MLLCIGKEDGNYLYLVGYCFGYYKCEGGVVIVVKCLKGIMFDVVRKICMFGGKCILWWNGCILLYIILMMILI